jgi:ABC-type transporter Mla MlaB component
VQQRAIYKITAERQPGSHSVTLLLDGKISEDALPALRASLSAAREGGQTIYMDLSEVTLVDRKAVQFFSEQAGEDVKLVNCPNYLCHWIRQVSDENEKH